MLNQQSRIMYDDNEIQYKNIINEKPIRYNMTSNTRVNNTQFDPSLHYNVDIGSNLREQPTRLNTLNRSKEHNDDGLNIPYSSAPKGKNFIYQHNAKFDDNTVPLRNRSIDEESQLFFNRFDDIRCKSVFAKENIYQMEQLNYFDLKPQNDISIFPMSSRNSNKNYYVST